MPSTMFHTVLVSILFGLATAVGGLTVKLTVPRIELGRSNELLRLVQSNLLQRLASQTRPISISQE